MKVPPLEAYTRRLGQLVALETPNHDGSLAFANDTDVPPWAEALFAETAPHSSRTLRTLSRAVAAVERGESVHAFARSVQPQTKGEVAAFFADASPATLATIDAVCAERAPISAQHLASLGIEKEAVAAFRLVSAAVSMERDLHTDHIRRGIVPVDLPSEPTRARRAL